MRERREKSSEVCLFAAVIVTGVTAEHNRVQSTECGRVIRISLQFNQSLTIVHQSHFKMLFHSFISGDGTIFLYISLLLLATSNAVSALRSSGAVRGLDVNDDPSVNVSSENTSPILGVLSQEVSRLILREYPGRSFTSYIAASYVKFVEGAGGRVVPIWIGQPRDYYVDIMSKINGVLLPGGATFFNQSEGYADAGKHILEIAKDLNDRGVYTPVWGTCLGFELLVYLTANGTDPRTTCSSSRQALPLEFKDGYEKSRLFRNASDEIVDYLKNYAVTANFHMYCFTEETFAALKLNETWQVMSVNHDWNGQEFISTIEHKHYPFYGVQFHPEKNLYEFVANHNITHTTQAVRTSQYFANFLVNESRRNHNRFANKTEEMTTLIYNYQPEFTSPVGSAFVQQYLFEVKSNNSSSSGASSSATSGLVCLTLSVIALITVSN